jgi:hypothetical protein
MAAMEARIRSASLGPPRREFRAAASGASRGSEVVAWADAEEFSTLHLRRLESPGSMVVVDEDASFVLRFGGGAGSRWGVSGRGGGLKESELIFPKR